MKNFILLAMAIATSTVVGAQAPNYIPSEGLVGWWPLDGNALDGGSFENHGTVSGAVGTTNRYNEASGAMAFDGIDDHIVVADAPSLQITGDLTISLWYTTPGPTGNYQTFLTKRSGGQWPYSFGLSHYYGGGGCPGELDKYVTGRRNNGSEYDLRVTEKTYVSNQWTHAALTIENDVITFYENGLPIGSTCFGNEFFVSPIDQGAPLTFGTCNCGLTEMMTGSLDDIGIWNRALSPDEIATVFESIVIVEGCTDPDACNFDSDANEDNNSCAYGCTECGEGTTWNPSTFICEAAQSCDTIYTPDYDSDGFIGLSDILGILSVYGQAWPPFDCGNPVEYQGYDYATVQIGDQCWFAENVRYLPSVSSPDVGSEDDGQPHAYVYGYSGTDTTEATSYESYIINGALYNFPAVNQWQLCPSGWSVPSDSAWMELELSLGINPNELNWYYPNQGFERGHDENVGAQLKASDWDGDGTSGFNARPSGWRWDNTFAFQEYANFWTSSALDGSVSWSRILSTGENGIGRQPYYPHFGKSVRCVKDAE